MIKIGICKPKFVITALSFIKYPETSQPVAPIECEKI